MTTPVVTVRPDTTVYEIATLLVDRRISGVPVVEDNGRIVGIVTESDLLHRPEIGTANGNRSLWRVLFTLAEYSASAYKRSHGMRASDVMAFPVTTVDEGISTIELVKIMDERGAKLVPVVRGACLVGIVSPVDVLKGLTAWDRDASSGLPLDDDAIRDGLLADLKREPWADLAYAAVTVKDGTAYLWGMVRTVEQIEAMVIATERTPGVQSVVNHLSTLQSRMFWGE